MTGAPSVLSDRLADCEADGIRLSLAREGRLTIYAQQDAPTPAIFDRLKNPRSRLLAILGVNADICSVDPTGATVVWAAALGVLNGDPLFRPAVLEGLKAANVRWGEGGFPGGPSEERCKRSRPNRQYGC